MKLQHKLAIGLMAATTGYCMYAVHQDYAKHHARTVPAVATRQQIVGGAVVLTKTVEMEVCWRDDYVCEMDNNRKLAALVHEYRMASNEQGE